MAQQSSQQEPTMEEILASIRRIISEDTEEAEVQPVPAAAKAPAPQPIQVEEEDEPEEEVLELTQVIEEEPVAVQPEPELESEPIPEPVRAKPVTRPKPVVVEEEDVMLVDRERESVESGLMSAAASNAMASAFGQLQARSRVANDPSVTLEDIVREMMKPILKEWLDENLPPLAERLVREEIERVSRGPQRR